MEGRWPKSGKTCSGKLRSHVFRSPAHGYRAYLTPRQACEQFAKKHFGHAPTPGKTSALSKISTARFDQVMKPVLGPPFEGKASSPKFNSKNIFKDPALIEYAERELIWSKASANYTYPNIWELIQDMEEANAWGSSLSIQFQCDIHAVIETPGTELNQKHEALATRLFNHVVLIKTPAVEVAEPNWSMVAVTCYGYMEQRWSLIGVQALDLVLNNCNKGVVKASHSGSKFQRFACSLFLRTPADVS